MRCTGKQDNDLAIALSLLLLAIYLLTASGRFHSDDEMSVFAVAQSLVGRGEVTIDQIAWNQDLGGGVGRALPDGRVFSKYGIGGSLLEAPLIFLASVIPWAGQVPAAMLLEPILTALTGGILFLSAKNLGYRTGIAVALALAFGVATPAWVYARYGFGEPAVAFCWVAAFWLVWASGPDAGEASRSIRFSRLVLAGSALGLSILVRSTSAAVVPAFLILLLRYRPKFGDIAGFVFPIAISGALVAAYNLLRFGSVFDAGYNSNEGFTAPLLQGLGGLLVSPGRGLLFYGPLCASGAFGLLLLWKRHRTVTAAIVVLVATTVLLNAFWHAWHGGWGWGPRLILPAVPFLSIGLLPVLEFCFPEAAGRSFQLTRIGAIVVTGSLAIAGIGVNLIGILVDFNRYLLALLAENPEMAAGVMFQTLDDWGKSPIPNHLGLLPAGPPDLLWWTADGIFLPALAVAIFAVALGLRLVVARVRDDPGAGVLQAALVVSMAAFGAASLHIGYSTSRYSAEDRQIAGALERVRSLPPSSAIVAVMAGHAEPLLNRAPLKARLLQILPEGTPLSNLATRRLSKIAGRTPLDLVQLGASEVGPDNGVESLLDQISFKGEAGFVQDARLVRYYRAPEVQILPTRIDFGDRMRLEGAWAGIMSGQVLVELRWSAIAPIRTAYSVSVRLTAPNGDVVAQKDREPLDGAAPTADWKPGEIYVDRFAVPAPLDRASPPYGVSIVVYPSAGGAPLLSGGQQVVQIGTVDQDRR